MEGSAKSRRGVTSPAHPALKGFLTPLAEDLISLRQSSLSLVPLSQPFQIQGDPVLLPLSLRAGLRSPIYLPAQQCRFSPTLVHTHQLPSQSTGSPWLKPGNSDRPTFPASVLSRDPNPLWHQFGPKPYTNPRPVNISLAFVKKRSTPAQRLPRKTPPQPNPMPLQEPRRPFHPRLQIPLGIVKMRKPQPSLVRPPLKRRQPSVQRQINRRRTSRRHTNQEKY